MNNYTLEGIYPKLYCLYFNECDKKKCTAYKLKNLKMLQFIFNIRGSLDNAILLHPFSNNIISEEDADTMLKNGLIVLDCSWNNIFNLKNVRNKNLRKLPPLIASNPVNYGKWEKLNSAEALAAALYITKFTDLADLILSKFSWGNEFKRLNGF